MQRRHSEDASRRPADAERPGRGGPAGSESDTAGARAQLTRLTERIRRQLGAADVAALVVLIMASFHLVAQNGGRAPRDMLWVLVAGAIGTLFLIPTLRRTSRGFVWLCAAWSLGFLVALAAAEIRADAVRPLTAAALAPAVALAAVRVWRRPWGPAALGTILALTAARSWYLTFLAWWGGSMGRSTWLALSWHNQSGTLMGTLGVAATAAAAVLQNRGNRNEGTREKGAGTDGIRAAALIAGIIAGACLAGAWLSGSRGAVITTGVGIAAVVIGLARAAELKGAAPALIGVAVATAAVVGGLEAMVQSDAGQPLAARDQSAAGNMVARMGYWRAAIGMAGSRPLTGWGPGSYRWASLPHYPGDTGLTSSVHNEYLEALAETGLIGAAPVWLAAIALAILAARVLLRKPSPAIPRVRRAGAVAAAAAVAVLGLHAGMDFDWDYPVLMALLAMAGAVLWVERSEAESGRSPPAPRPAGWPLALAGGGSLLLLLGVAIAGAALTAAGRAPWELRPALAGAMAAAEAGDFKTARSQVATAERWNPGAPSVPIAAAVVRHHAGAISDSALASMVDSTTTAHPDQILVAQRLLESGNARAARGILDGLVPVLETRRRWNVQTSVAQVAELWLRTEAELEGCPAVERSAGRVGRWADGFGLKEETLEGMFRSVREDTGCESAPDQ